LPWGLDLISWAQEKEFKPTSETRKKNKQERSSPACLGNEWGGKTGEILGVLEKKLTLGKKRQEWTLQKTVQTETGRSGSEPSTTLLFLWGDQE